MQITDRKKVAKNIIDSCKNQWPVLKVASAKNQVGNQDKKIPVRGFTNLKNKDVARQP